MAWLQLIWRGETKELYLWIPSNYNYIHEPVSVTLAEALFVINTVLVVIFYLPSCRCDHCNAVTLVGYNTRCCREVTRASGKKWFSMVLSSTLNASHNMRTTTLRTEQFSLKWPLCCKTSKEVHVLTATAAECKKMGKLDEIKKLIMESYCSPGLPRLSTRTGTLAKLRSARVLPPRKLPKTCSFIVKHCFLSLHHFFLSLLSIILRLLQK